MNKEEQEAYIFGAMFALSNRLQVIGDQFDSNVTVKQWLFLASVARYEGIPSISEIAASIGYSRQNAKRIATDLAEKGFLRLERDEHDGRAWRVNLTEYFYAYFGQRAEREEAFMQQLFQGFDQKTVEGLFAGLVQLNASIEAMETKKEE